MTKNKKDPTKKQSKKSKIKKLVEDRIKEEETKYPVNASDPNNGKIPSNFIRQCLANNELGDGILFAEVMRGKFLYNNITGE